MAAAGILGISLSDFTIGGQDLWLLAANQIVKTAELDHDFEFNRKTVSVSVNGTTGGDLGTAVDSNSASVNVKTVIEVGVIDNQGNLVPVIWTTTAESIERQRGDNRNPVPLFRRDYDQDIPLGLSRFTFSGDQIFRWPKTVDSEPLTFALQMEVYAFTSPWTSSDLGGTALTVTGTLNPDVTGIFILAGTDSDGKNYYIRNTAPALLYPIIRYDGSAWMLEELGVGNFWSFTSASLSPVGSYLAIVGTGNATVAGALASSNIWTTHGSQFLLWQSIVHLNKHFRVFVPRQEGNLPPPTDLAQEGLQTLIDWDTNKFELFRRHNR